MNTIKIFGIVLEDKTYKAYELKELEGSGVYVNYILQCTTPQVNTVLQMLNNIMKIVK